MQGLLVFLRRAWTWVPCDLGGSVEIPGELSRYFHSPPIRGPVSLFRRFVAGVRETDLGTVVLSPKPEFRAFEIWDTATGTFRPATRREILRWQLHTAGVQSGYDALLRYGGGHVALYRHEVYYQWKARLEHRTNAR